MVGSLSARYRGRPSAIAVVDVRFVQQGLSHDLSDVGHGPQIRCSITASFTYAHGRFRMPIALVVEATGLYCYYIAGI